MSVPSSRFLVLIYLLCIVNCRDISAQKENEEGKVYIVYLGHKEHDDIERITNSHYDILAKVLQSKDAASKAMVYSYRHGFSGFAAKLTKSQARELEDLPEVIQVTASTTYTKRTTRSNDYLGLTIDTPNNNLLDQANMGDGMIIGVIDSGIWPESESFNDKGLGSIPSRWKGSCEEGDDGSFDPKKHCNRKLIGARWFMRTFIAESATYNASKNTDFVSPRDGPEGHGTHVAGTAAGSIVPNVSFNGMSRGTLHGAAPMARIASYKVCWVIEGGLSCSGADILAAMDQAIIDGVDVIQISLGGGDLPIDLETEKLNGLAIGAYHAFQKGIIVVTAAGNEGPTLGTVNNVAPWVLDVGASTIDRSSPTPIFLDNNITLVGQAAYNGNGGGPHKIHYECDCNNINDPRNPEVYDSACKLVEGKMLTCFSMEPRFNAFKLMERVSQCKGFGIIASKAQCDILITSNNDFSFFVSINYEDGCKLSRLVSANKDVEARVGPSVPLEGRAVPVEVAYFSARGPSTAAPEILKPDIIAPGANILAATPATDGQQINGYAIKSGTSMAAPHVSGIVLLLKSIHPDWSPATIISAIVTTGRTTDESGYPIFANGDPPKAADAFDMGGGIVNPNAAADPGLIYEIDLRGYEDYLCAMHYRKAAISRLVQHRVKCPKESPSLLDVNLPSVTIPCLRNSTTLTRTVTNVGPVNSIYKALVNPPDGTKVVVKPDVLVFNSNVKTVSFTVTVSPIQKVNLGIYTFGSLTWSDGVHNVRSPVSVKVEAFES